MRFGLQAGVLRGEQGIGHAVHEPAEIVVARFGSPQFAPPAETVDIGAEGQEDRCRRCGGLVEMQGGELFQQLPRCGYYNAVQLHVPHGGSPRGRLEYLFHDRGGDGFGFVSPNRLCSRISFIIVVFLWYNPYKGSNSCGGCDRTRFDFAWPCLPGKEQIPCIFPFFFLRRLRISGGGMTHVGIFGRKLRQARE